MDKRRSIEVSGVKHQNPIPAASRKGPFVVSGAISGADSEYSSHRHSEAFGRGWNGRYGSSRICCSVSWSVSKMASRYARWRAFRSGNLVLCHSVMEFTAARTCR